METRERIIPALDNLRFGDMTTLADALAPHVGPFKIGLKDIVSNGRRLVEVFREDGRRLMYDAKLHEIPETMAMAAQAIAEQKVMMFTIHASAGPEGIRQAVLNRGESMVLGVTVLTSHSCDECVSIFGDEPKVMVKRFAKWLIEAGAQGVVCSPEEAAMIRQEVDPDRRLIIVTPGIRPEWFPITKDDDQKRTMTPSQAIRAGADYLVIGRPILQPPKEIGKPSMAVKRIAEEIEDALAH